MARRERPRVAGLPVHIIQRGNNRQVCFYAEADHRFFLRQLSELATRCWCKVHAYVLMTNHVHLLLTPSLPEGVSLLMKLLGQRYVQYINRIYGRSGTLWDGRFRSSLVQDSRYVLACYRYIEMNPVRPNMVKHPAEYPWSSYASNAIGQAISWLTPHGEYLALGSNDEKRQAAYRGLFDGEINPQLLRDIRIATHGGYSLGRTFRIETVQKLLHCTIVDSTYLSTRLVRNLNLSK
jgi:putative transposase